MIKIYIKKHMEPVYWERVLSLLELTKENELWSSLVNLNLLFSFIVTAFKNSAVIITVASNQVLNL